MNILQKFLISLNHNQDQGKMTDEKTSSNPAIEVLATEIVVCSVAYQEIFVNLKELQQEQPRGDEAFEQQLLSVQEKAVTLGEMVNQILADHSESPEANKDGKQVQELFNRAVPLLAAINLSCVGIIAVEDRAQFDEAEYVHGEVVTEELADLSRTPGLPSAARAHLHRP